MTQALTTLRNFECCYQHCSSIFQQFELNRDVAASPRSHRPDIRLLDEHCDLIVIGLILGSPTLYLHEVCQQIQEITSLSVSQATICTFLQRYGLIDKKKLSKLNCRDAMCSREHLWLNVLSFQENNLSGWMRQAQITFVDLATQSEVPLQYYIVCL